jgi:hypothetical protein
MDRPWKVRRISHRGEACFSFAVREHALQAAAVFRQYPGAEDDVIIETPDRRFIPADRLDTLDRSPSHGSPVWSLFEIASEADEAASA